MKIIFILLILTVAFSCKSEKSHKLIKISENKITIESIQEKNIDTLDLNSNLNLRIISRSLNDTIKKMSVGHEIFINCESQICKTRSEDRIFILLLSLLGLILCFFLVITSK